MSIESIKESLDKASQEARKIDQYYNMAMRQAFNYEGPIDLIIFRIKFYLSKILCLGSDARIYAALSLPVLLLTIRMDTSKIAVWLEGHFRIRISTITGVAFKIYLFIVRMIASSVTYYWCQWMAYYLNHDTDYHTTINKITKNPIVPLDMIGFYKALVWGNDPIFEFVKDTAISLQLSEEYRSRQTRNGLVPQF